MWICLNDAFLSIVDKTGDSELLLVRARREGDIERVFPGFEVEFTPSADYRYRAKIPRWTVSDTISQRIEKIDYVNFKNSVSNDRLHNAYVALWRVMDEVQTMESLTSGKKGKRKSK